MVEENKDLKLEGSSNISNGKTGGTEEVTTHKQENEALNIPEYNLERGVGILVDLIKEKMSKQGGSIVVEIAGGSASGKTSAVSKQIKELFGDEAILFSMDDYYRGKKFMESESQKGNELNWDQPEALNLELLREQLTELKSGHSIQKPIYDMKNSEPSGVQRVEPARVVIIEGLFALDDTIKGEGDVKCFIDTGTHGRIIRRLLRDIERTGQSPTDIINYFAEVVEPMHDKYIQSTKRNADLIINNEYNPEVEAEKSGLHEVQIKFKSDVNNEQLRKLGAERLSSTVQIDSYYNPKDRDLVKTGEILRIRQEGDRRILTYKGPKTESAYRERPKFEFEIDEDTERKLLSIYGDKVKTINKTRVLYQLDNIVFAVEQVMKIENGQTTNLGSFIEIRSLARRDETEKDKEQRKTNIEKLLEDLGLREESRIKESYFDM